MTNRLRSSSPLAEERRNIGEISLPLCTRHLISLALHPASKMQHNILFVVGRPTYADESSGKWLCFPRVSAPQGGSNGKLFLLTPAVASLGYDPSPCSSYVPSTDMLPHAHPAILCRRAIEAVTLAKRSLQAMEFTVCRRLGRSSTSSFAHGGD